MSVTAELKVSMGFKFQIQTFETLRMDKNFLVRQWIEMKLGEKISEDIKKKIIAENSRLDVKNYVNHLLETYFHSNNVKNLEKEIFEQISTPHLGSDFSAEPENESQYSLDLEVDRFNTYMIEEFFEITENTSEEFVHKYLEELEFCLDLRLTNWNLIRKNLQALLNKNLTRKTQLLVLKIFQKLLMCPNQPLVVCEAFNSLTEAVVFYFDLFNAEEEVVFLEKVYDIKKEKWCNIKTPTENKGFLGKTQATGVVTETLAKSMWLLIECQKQMPEKWMRFNERRLREIIFSFIHLLGSTTTSELQSDKLSGLELLSILSPTARWCRQWCHTATGRFLLCSALRKYRHFFIHVVEIILINIKIKKQSQLPTEVSSRNLSSEKNMNVPKPVKISSSKTKKDRQNKILAVERNEYPRSAPTKPTILVQGGFFREKKWTKKKEYFFQLLIGNISQTIVTQAVCLHCISLVVCLIQHRSGRSLFPVHTSLKKRLLSVQDLTTSITEYLESDELKESSLNKIVCTNEYRRKIVYLINSLNEHKSSTVSSRMSAEKFASSRR